MSREKIKLSTIIKASKEKVWKVLLDDKTYRQWVAVFMEGSYAETDWKEGSKALFLSPEGDGMRSRIKKHIHEEVITIEHLGMVEKRKEIFDSEQAKAWSGTCETYRVKELNGETKLEIEQDVNEEYKDYFEKTWKQALQKIKELAE